MALYQLSADPGLGQGRGGAWDHRRCGTSPSSLSTVKPILQPSSHINSFCRLPALKPSKLHRAANSHSAPHTNRFFWPLLHPTATPRPHINGFLSASKFAVCQPLQTLTGIQVCRLPALKPSKPFKPSKPSKPSKRLIPSKPLIIPSKPLKTVKPLKR